VNAEATESAAGRHGIDGKWKLDPLHSTVMFVVRFVVGPFRSKFEQFDAKIEDGRLTGHVVVESIDIRHEMFRQRMFSEDFFDAPNYPEISFESTNLTIEGDAITVDGNLTIRDVTKAIRATGIADGPTADSMGMTRIGLTLSTVIRQSDYGIEWNVELPGGGLTLGREVELQVELAFVSDDDAAA
jgi:polyisoprenoid-binding protein YceI